VACFPWESQEEVIECKSTNRELSNFGVLIKEREHGNGFISCK